MDCNYVRFTLQCVDHHVVAVALGEAKTEDVDRISPLQLVYYISIRMTEEGQNVRVTMSHPIVRILQNSITALK
jgi:hypothetical protein